MKPDYLVMVDLTERRLRLGVVALSDTVPSFPARQTSGLWLSDGLLFPSRVVAHRRGNSGSTLLAGSATTGCRAGNNALVFEDLWADLPNIADTDVAAELYAALWQALRRDLFPVGNAICYVIVPDEYSPALCDKLRAASAGVDESFRLVGFLHQAPALLLGLLQKGFFVPWQRNATFAPISLQVLLVPARGEAEYLGFTYSVSNAEKERQYDFILRDYARFAPDAAPARLPAGTETPTFALHSEHLAPDVCEKLRRVPQLQLIPHTAPEELKLLGAAYLAQCSVGHGDSQYACRVAMAFDLGLKIGKGQFHTLLTKEKYGPAAPFPQYGMQAFTFSGAPLELGFYAGFAPGLSGATWLCQATINPWDLSRGDTLVAVARLDAPGSGEFTLGSLPGNTVLWREPFTLPGILY